MMRTAPLTSRRGISLLEVLISIGILSIGLLASLALIPAGRTYMKKAAVDDRAAALVPNAYVTMKTLGLLSEGSLIWAPPPPLTDRANPEPWPVIREQAGTDVTTVSPTGSTIDAGWTIETIDEETITAWHGQNLPPFSITGAVPPIPPATEGNPRAPSYNVTVTCSTTWQVNGTTITGASNPYDGPNGSTTANPDTGNWSFPLSPRPFAAPDMTIFTSGANVGQPSNNTGPNNTGNNSSVLYTFDATYLDTLAGTSPPPKLNANPSFTSFRQFGRRRAVDHRKGQARTTYTKPANAVDANHDRANATNISLPELENLVSQQTGQLATFVQQKTYGTLWRMQIGTRRGIYEQDVDFDATDNAPPRPRNPVFPNADITDNAGYTWIDGAGNPQSGPDGTPEDRDWFRFDVSAGNVLEVSWNDADGVLLGDDDAVTGSGNKFPIYFKELLTPMWPLRRETARYTYTIPQDGYVTTRAQLQPAAGAVDIFAKQNTFGARATARSIRRNPEYDFTIKLSRSDRVVVIDPLMANRLDKIISLGNPGGNVGRFDPYYVRRHRFADFQQTFAGGGSPRAFIVPRLNWQPYASADIDTRLAMAEVLFREQDKIAIDMPTNEDDAPTPLFDLGGATPSPIRRQAEGRMSWLLMLQPEDPGSVQANWHAGNYFDVSLVIFEDRKLPAPVADAVVDGEYAMSGTWSDLTGQITVNVPTSGANAGSTAGLDEEDLRQLFKTGAHILLAPRTVYDASLLDSTQKLDWVKIQTSQIEPNGSNGFVVKVMPEREPDDSRILYRSVNPTATEFPLVVLAYQGVVTVVTKSMRLEP